MIIGGDAFLVWYFNVGSREKSHVIDVTSMVITVCFVCWEKAKMIDHQQSFHHTFIWLSQTPHKIMSPCYGT